MLVEPELRDCILRAAADLLLVELSDDWANLAGVQWHVIEAAESHGVRLWDRRARRAHRGTRQHYAQRPMVRGSGLAHALAGLLDVRRGRGVLVLRSTRLSIECVCNAAGQHGSASRAVEPNAFFLGELRHSLNQDTLRELKNDERRAPRLASRRKHQRTLVGA